MVYEFFDDLCVACPCVARRQVAHRHATHGFFLPEDKKEVAERMECLRVMGGVGQKRVVLQNPMHRSGFALAGAQDTLDAWGRGEVPDTANDGIVTAGEDRFILIGN